MLTLDLENFMVEFEDGTLKHVGASDTAATVKLYHADDAEAREFGDDHVKLTAEDGEGNEVTVALGPEALRSLRSDLRALEMGED
jgi:hypothetical protein